MKGRLVNVLASLLIAGSVGLIVHWGGGPKWAVAGFVMITYLIVVPERRP